ncbi:oxidoreductase [Kitasatospora sp. NPDC056531]|uniref:oxidoreductase n=1 Tax=Kitasatospora sp. NPDC056531 TaxID=3345856 RepID=UPI0036A53D7B
MTSVGPSSAWDLGRVPDQSGRLAVVTGANSGIGWVTALELARRGASVVLACRSAARGADALARLREEAPAARFELRTLDLADLGSVRAFAEGLEHDRVDLLVNNAGLAMVPFARTADGFETHLGVNHLGPFALTGLLLPRLLRAREPRVVTVSSEAQRVTRFRLERLGAERRYRAFTAYLLSKRANLYFGMELQRRADDSAAALRSFVVAPGLTRSNVLASEEHTGQGGLYGELLPRLARLLAKPTADGALTSVYAATEPELPGGSYVVPGGPLQQRGAPVARREPAMRDRATAGRLWELSERLTGVTFRFGSTGG